MAHLLCIARSNRGFRAGRRRPVLVISREQINQMLPVINVIPLTTRKTAQRIIYPNEVLLPVGTAGLPNESIALCYQLRTLDKRRLERQIGRIDDLALRVAIRTAIQFQLEV